jgi:hypothetical protein
VTRLVFEKNAQNVAQIILPKLIHNFVHSKNGPNMWGISVMPKKAIAQ